MEKAEMYLEKVRKVAKDIPLLQQAEAQTGVEAAYLLLGAGAASVVFTMVILGPGALTNMVGFIYPTYMSMKAIETQSKKDDVQWLTYWVVYAAFQLIEVFVHHLLYWIPFYFAFKLGFLCWLFLPNTMGATFIYAQFLEPFLAQNETKFDAAIKKVVDNASTVAKDFSSTAADLGTEVTKAAATKLADKKEE